MKKLDEVQNYLDNKRDIYKTILFAIDEALKNDATKIWLKGLKIMEEKVDAIADREDWQGCIEKALGFFEKVEDYESCQECVNLLNRVLEKQKK